MIQGRRRSMALHRADETTGVEFGAESGIGRSAAIRSLTAGRHVVYAIRVPDGAVKIGCTKNLNNRLSGLRGELLAFDFGGFDRERELHERLSGHLVRGREYFADTPEVQAVVAELMAGLIGAAA